MNILFLTMAQMLDINNYGIYTDLMRKSLPRPPAHRTGYARGGSARRKAAPPTEASARQALRQAKKALWSTPFMGPL